jgi:hypothetical protein
MALTTRQEAKIALLLEAFDGATATNEAGTTYTTITNTTV